MKIHHKMYVISQVWTWQTIETVHLGLKWIITIHQCNCQFKPSIFIYQTPENFQFPAKREGPKNQWNKKTGGA